MAGNVIHQPLVRYGKSNSEYVRAKNYYTERSLNRSWLDRAVAASAKYAEQPERKMCVACRAPLGRGQLRYLRVDYALCGACGHFNGLHEDTLEFSKFLYEQEHGGASVVYQDDSTETFMQRVQSVYLPKVNFLVEALRSVSARPSEFRYADFGAGAGHFVVALRESGLSQAIGYEASDTLVNSTNRRFGCEMLRHSPVDGLASLAESVDAEVVTMIFSLEHIYDLNRFMMAMRRNRSLRYFYFAVPLYSPSALIDIAFPNLAPRVLGLGHTHLFTDRSIDMLCSRFQLRRIAEWWFGGNAFDIIRNIGLSIDGDSANEEWMRQMAIVIDGMQLAFDHQKLSSEVHIVAAIEN